MIGNSLCDTQFWFFFFEEFHSLVIEMDDNIYQEDIIENIDDDVDYEFTDDTTEDDDVLDVDDLTDEDMIQSKLDQEGKKDEKTLSVTIPLEKWENLFEYVYLDIINDLGASKNILIEADSLILNILNLTHIDWSHGGQFLQVIYHVEYILDIIKNCANFVLVYFDDNSILYEGLPDSFLLGRYIIISHLKNYCEVHNFKNFLDDEWKTFVDNFYPAFIIADYYFTNDSTKRNLLASFIIETNKLFPIVLFRGMKPSSTSTHAFCLPIQEYNYDYDVKSEYLKATSRSVESIDLETLPDVVKSEGWRMILTYSVLTHLLKTDETLFQWAKIILIHSIMLKYLPLELRAQNLIQVESEVDIKENCISFINLFTNALLKYLPIASFGSFNNNLYDIIDGRLFYQVTCIVAHLQYNTDQDLLEKLGLNKEMISELLSLWDCISGGNSFYPIFVQNFEIKEFRIIENDESNDVKISQINNELIDSIYSSEEKKLLSKYEIQSRKEKDPIYDHNKVLAFKSKLKRHEKDNTKGITDKRQLVRLNQNFFKFIHNYNPPSFSLPKGRTSFIRLNKSIEDSSNNGKNDENEAPKDKKKKGKKQKPGAGGGKKGLSKKEQIIAKNKLQLLKKEEESDEKIYQSTIEDLKAIEENKRNKFLEDRFYNIKTPKYKIKSSIFMINKVFLKKWTKQFEYGKPKEIDFTPAILAIRKIYDTYLDYRSHMSENDVEQLCKAFNKLGYETCSKQLMNHFKDPSSKHPIEWSPKDLYEEYIPLSPIRFQLKYMEHLMDRDTDSCPDPRVDFWPDKWQRDLLDVIDRNESALVSAPTSAGKTFISFYIIEKVLKTPNSNGIVVYVAPTRALINQVAAELYARFNSYTLNKGETLIGIAEQKYTRSLNTCRILVTVPEVFEKLLLIPENFERFIPRIKYVIMDEIHCINEKEGGTWERILSLISSPFLAMSATISNGDSFTEWLRSFDSKYPVNYIQHHQRFSELRKSIYDARKPNKLIRINPCSVLDVKTLSTSGFPSTMSLTSFDTTEIFDLMKESISDYKLDDESVLKELTRLDPDNFFKYDLSINQKRAKEYEKDIKNFFVSLSKSYPSVVEKVLNTLSSCIDGNEMPESIVDVVEHLRKKQMLPALFFSFSAPFIQKQAKELIEYYLNNEEAYINSREYEKKIKDIKAKSESQQKAIDKIKNEILKAKLQNEQDEISEDIEGLLDEKFTLTLSGEVLPVSDLEKELRVFQKIHIDDYLVEGLRRGIGIHYPTFHRKYLQLVEKLFRMGHLKVVFASVTLALGVNMPCKTVVFHKDSYLLTPTYYQQMSGRAGRRGFDPVGDVIFCNIPIKKVKELLLSEVPALKGRFPFTVTLLLEIMSTLKEIKPSCLPVALNSLPNLFKNPLNCKGKIFQKDQLKYLVRFYMEFLLNEELINQNGYSINHSYLVSLLHENEPSNLVLNSALQHIESICNQETYDSKQLVQLLETIFNRHLPNAHTQNNFESNEPQFIQNYNNRVLQTFVEYIKFYANTHKLLESLPISNIEFNSKIDLNFEDNSLLGIIKKSSIKYLTRSPFVALSGHGDTYEYGEELIFTSRKDVYIDYESIPILPTRDIFGNVLKFDKFYSNFFSKKMELSELGYSELDAFQIAVSFLKVLKTIVDYFKIVSPESKLHNCLENLYEECLKKHNTVFGIKEKKF